MSNEMLLNKILELDPIKEMRVGIDASIKYGAIVGATTIVSSILGGRIGLLIGGVAGSLLAGFAANGTYESVSYIFTNKISKKDIQKLLEKIGNFILSHGMTILEFIRTVNISQNLVDGIKEIVISFLVKMGLQIFSAKAISSF